MRFGKKGHKSPVARYLGDEKRPRHDAEAEAKYREVVAVLDNVTNAIAGTYGAPGSRQASRAESDRLTAERARNMMRELGYTGEWAHED